MAFRALVRSGSRLVTAQSRVSARAPVFRGLASAAGAGDIKAKFDEVCRTKGPSIAVAGSNEQKLRAYALFKQATKGDVEGSRPGMMDFVGRAKYDAWAGLKGTSSTDAMKAYVSEFGGSDADASGDVAATPKDKYSPPGNFAEVRKSPMLPAGCFKGKVALITGGGTGLGKAMATTLSSLGATVCITSRKQEVLDATAAEISKATGNPVYAFAGDVRNAEAIDGVLDKLQQVAGLPDIVINNAAGNFIARTEKLSANAFKNIIDIVLNGTAIVTLAAGKRMIAAKKGGVFLAITTTYAPDGSAYVVPSACAKSGVHALTKSLAAEWGQYGLRFVGVAPGPIETKGAFTRLDPTGMFKDRMIERLPSKRLGEPEELANLIAYMVSDYASWMTGEIVTFDGGEKVALGGEFNALQVVTPEMWDAMEALTRKAK